MSIITAGTFHAMASVEANGGVSSFLPGSKHPGFTSVALTGVGLWDFTLDEAADATQCLMLATPRSAIANQACQSFQTASDTVKRVETYQAGVLASNVNFDVVIFRIPEL